MRDALTICGRGIDRSIAATYLNAKKEGRYVTDVSFMEAVKKRYGIREQVDFLLTPTDKVLVVCYNPEGTPILKTILTPDMIDGFVLQTMSKEELGKVFKRWQFEIRHKTS